MSRSVFITATSYPRVILAATMVESIRMLARQYFQLVDPPQLAIPPNNILIQPTVQEALYEHMFNESLTPLPPAPYRARVLKLLLSRIEEAITDPEEDEIHDTLMETWASLLTTPKPPALQQAQQLSKIKYTAPSPGSERTVITSESRGVILSGGTTGNRTWEAALHLGSFLSTPPGAELVRGKRIIELGAGTGFLSLFCARHLDVKNVVCTDREMFLVENMRECVRLNNLEVEGGGNLMVPTIWDWGTPLDLDKTELSDDSSGEGEMEFDIALGADLIYDADIIPLLLSTVRDLFENYAVKEFVIAATLRNERTFQTFLDGCETNSFNVETLTFESTPSEEQTGFFHSTSIPIHTYRITQRI
ncbi:hypothetical protein N7532_002385 [Penicillium argentinense]|uniref:Uncharacterized protein n=1 Tax=Penicillium argentinense TaxID=1131581 RepID=A0A9W9KKK4_9EURO|nr:uncharacterized protein N7532_002385 [Penicillium argentinense]KAJ5109740.1 hypothetical protein N7532_002385 [Penicillium argentinense]